MSTRDALMQKLGLQSWCLRNFKKTDEVIRELKACGLANIELCGVHADPVRDPNIAALVETYRSAGIAITAFGVHGFRSVPWEPDARKVFEFAKLAGFPTLSVDLDSDALPMATRLSREYGVRLAVHNHGRKHKLGSPNVLDRLFYETGPEVGLCLDTAWMIDSGEDALAVAKRFRERLYGVHLKDFVFTRAGKPEDVVLGTGNLDLNGLMKFLVDTAYDGYLTIEYEGSVENPTPQIKECVTAVRQALQAGGG